MKTNKGFLMTVLLAVFAVAAIAAQTGGSGGGTGSEKDIQGVLELLRQVDPQKAADLEKQMGAGQKANEQGSKAAEAAAAQGALTIVDQSGAVLKTARMNPSTCLMGLPSGGLDICQRAGTETLIMESMNFNGGMDLYQVKLPVTRKNFSTVLGTQFGRDDKYMGNSNVEILSHNGPAYKVKVSGAGTFLTWRSGAQERIPAWISGVIDVTYVGQKEVVSTGN